MGKDYNKHTFVICGYKESKYLEECVQSLKNQTVKSKIIISTSTPNSYIENIAKKYNLELFINPVSKGIGPDWNYALSLAKTDFVTLAHQDDVYDKDYTKNVLEAIKKYDDTIMVFTNGKEIRNRKNCTKKLEFKYKINYDFTSKIF